MLISTSLFASQPKINAPEKSINQNKKNLASLELNDNLISLFKSEKKDKAHMEELKNMCFKQANQAVPSLIKVMKNEDFPDHKRWLATFLLGQIMGEKSTAFIAKFSQHPNWMMRLASLKTLLALKQDQLLGLYAKALVDPALIVREQALENIRQLKITKVAPSVWNMLYDKTNYSGKEGKLQRTQLIGKIIRTLGDLKHKDVQSPMLKMIKNKKFSDLFEDLDYSLSKISGETSPKGNIEVKRHFWNKKDLASTSI
jgi:HEAT repeat protein